MSLVKTSPAVFDRLGADDAAQRDAGDLRRAAADVDDHVAFRSLDVETGAQRRGHRLVDHVDLAAAGMLETESRTGADFDVGRTRRDADHHTQRGGRRDCPKFLTFLIMPRSISSVALKSAITPSFSGRIVLMFRGGLLVHLARLMADGHDLARMHVERHDRRFIDHDLAVVDYQRVGRTESRWPAPVSVKKFP